MLIADAGGAPPAGPGIPGPGIPVSVLTAMRFHWVTAVASAVAGGAADAPKTASAPTNAPTATAARRVERLLAMFSPLCLPPGDSGSLLPREQITLVKELQSICGN